MSCKKLFFFLFFSLLCISIVSAQQNYLSFNESFNMVNPGSWNFSILSNRTRTDGATILNSVSENTGLTWYVGNMERASSNDGYDPGLWYNASFGFWHWNSPYSQDGIATLGYGAGNTDTSFIYTIMPDVFSITPSTNIGIMSNGSLFGIIFLDMNNNCILGIQNDGDSTPNSTIFNSHDYNPHSYCLGQDFQYTCGMELTQDPGLTPVRANLSMSRCISNSINNLKKIVLMTISGLAQNAYIDEFIITNYANGSNYMPSVNLTLDQDEFCMNGSYMQIPINVTVYDSENDTVYYINGKAQFSYNLNETVVEFSDEVLGIGLLPDATKIENSDLLLTDEICGIENNWNELYNTSAHNFVDWSHWLNPIPLWGLELNSNCSYYSNRTDYGLYYKITPMAGLSLKTRFAKWDGSDKLNISFYNIYRDELFSVEFRNYQANPGITNVYHKDTWLGNMTNSQGDIMEFYVSPMGFAYNVTVVGLLYGSKTFNITGDPYADQVRYIGFHVTGSSVLDEFKYQGVSYTYTFLDDVSQWTSEKPNHVNITYPGSYQIDIIYSDSEHYPGSSGTVSQNLKIYSEFECRYLDVDNVGIGTIDDHTTRTDPLGALAWLFGHGLVQFLNNTGYYEIGKILLWWIYIFMILILFFTTGRNSLSGPVLLSSIAVGFLALMVGYTSHFITSLILIAVSLAGPFAKLFGGD